MLLKNLKKIYISEYETVNDHGEKSKKWKYKGIAWLNMQQDVNELDRKSTGEVDYSIYKGRTDREYNIQKGNGISFEDILKLEKFIPDYQVLDANKIGNAYTYRMEKVQK